jgi:hypothetical protein
MRGIEHGLANISTHQKSHHHFFSSFPVFPTGMDDGWHRMAWFGSAWCDHRRPPTNTFRGRPLASSGSSHWQAGKLAQGTGPLSRALGDLTVFDLTGHATRDESGLPRSRLRLYFVRTNRSYTTRSSYGVLCEFLHTEVLTGAYGCTLQSAQLLERNASDLKSGERSPPKKATHSSQYSSLQEAGVALYHRVK